MQHFQIYRSSNCTPCRLALQHLLFTFCSKLTDCESQCMCSLTVTTKGNPAKRQCDCFYFHYCKAGHRELSGGTVIVAGFRILIYSEASFGWSLVTRSISVHCDVQRLIVFRSEKIDLWIHLACWWFSIMCFKFSDRMVSLAEMLEWFKCCPHSLICSSLSAGIFSWRPDPIFCLVHPRHTPSVVPLTSFVTSWSRLWGVSTAMMYALTCSTFCLVYISGNCMVSTAVFLMVRMTLTAPISLSSFSRFVCDVVVRRRT